MGCPFCRSQMTQLSRAYADVQNLDGEVLEISVSPVRRARLYAEKFRLPFPYLCDPDYQVRQQWGIASREHGLGHYVTSLVNGMRTTFPPNDFGTFGPPLDEMRRILNDDDMGFFIVDKGGIVRYATTGAYRADGSGVTIPGNEEVLQELEELRREPITRRFPRRIAYGVSALRVAAVMGVVAVAEARRLRDTPAEDRARDPVELRSRRTSLGLSGRMHCERATKTTS